MALPVILTSSEGQDLCPELCGEGLAADPQDG